MEISVFCDESCHLENDGQDVMVLGAVWCATDLVKSVSDALRGLKRQYGLKLPNGTSHGFEAKWAKISPSKAEYYVDVVKKFIDDDNLRFRSLIVRGKQGLNHEAFNQSHDEFYYKMYYNLLIRLIEQKDNIYNIYLDIKDTNGGPKTRKLHEYLCTKIRDSDCSTLKRVEQIRSDHSELMQLCDLLIGAISYYNRGQNGSVSKLKILDAIASHGRVYPRDISRTSFLSEKKINMFYWNGATSN